MLDHTDKMMGNRLDDAELTAHLCLEWSPLLLFFTRICYKWHNTEGGALWVPGRIWDTIGVRLCTYILFPHTHFWISCCIGRGSERARELLKDIFFGDILEINSQYYKICKKYCGNIIIMYNVLRLYA